MLFGLSLSLPPIASLLSSVMTKIIRKGKGMLGELIVNIGSYMALNPWPPKELWKYGTFNNQNGYKKRKVELLYRWFTFGDLF
jgi:hypothetical protein